MLSFSCVTVLDQNVLLNFVKVTHSCDSCGGSSGCGYMDPTNVDLVGGERMVEREQMAG